MSHLKSLKKSITEHLLMEELHTHIFSPRVQQTHTDTCTRTRTHMHTHTHTQSTKKLKEDTQNTLKEEIMIYRKIERKVEAYANNICILLHTKT